jgi:hypothetical protein
MNAPVVFLGPSLPWEAARAIAPDAVLLPPARQGDLYRAARSRRPRAIGLVDGLFREAPAVWHREILWALSEGIPVLGAASMGALRAAECDAFGMEGVGAIYRAYRDGRFPPFDDPFEDDDEVAILHAPAEAGWIAASDAMVDLRATLAAALVTGAIGPEGCAALARRLKRLPFPERSHARLLREAAALPEPGRGALEWLRHHRVAQKRRDAEELLARIGRASPDRRAPGFRFTHSLAWESFLATQAAAPPAGEEQGGGALLRELAVSDPVAWRELRLMAEGRPGLPAAAAPGAAALEDFRRRHGLWRRSALEAWLAAHDLDEAGLHRLLAREAALREQLRHPPGPATLEAMLDSLRLSGRHAGLKARLAGRAEGEDREAPGEAVLDAALRWWFEARAGLPPPPPGGEEAGARAHGFPDADGFRLAVWREYRAAMEGEAPDGGTGAAPRGGG